LLVLAGYNIAFTNSSSSLAGSSSANVPRVLGVLDSAGSFAVVGFTTNQYSGNNIRSGTTDGRGNYWGAGANSGTFYFGTGPTNTVQNAVANSVVLQDLGGNLYFSTSKTTPGIWKIPGTPTAPATAAVFLNAGSGSSPYAFAFNTNFTTAYVADDTLTGKGGVQRWNFNGSVWTVALGLVLFTFTSIGMGLLISLVSRTQQQAQQTVMFVLIPTMVLSGFIFPIESMPAAIVPLTYLIPLRYALVVLRGAFLKGSGILDMWVQFAAMVAFAVGIFGLAVSRFQKRLAE